VLSCTRSIKLNEFANISWLHSSLIPKTPGIIEDEVAVPVSDKFVSSLNAHVYIKFKVSIFLELTGQDNTLMTRS
jgi:hypothetical protein